MDHLRVQDDLFRRAEVVGLSPGGVIVIASHDRSDVRLLGSSGNPIARVLQAKAAALSPGGGFLVLPDTRGAVLVDLDTREARRVGGTWWKQPVWSRSGVDVRREGKVEVFRPRDGAVLAELRGAFGRAQLRADGKLLATLGGAGLIIFDWEARKRVFVVEQSFIGSVAMGADGTVAFVAPLRAELTIARAVLPSCDGVALDVDAQRAFEQGRKAKSPLISSSGLTSRERAALTRALRSLETELSPAFLERLRAVDDARTAAAILALRNAEDFGELADHASELAEKLSFEGPALHRRRR